MSSIGHSPAPGVNDLLGSSFDQEALAGAAKQQLAMEAQRPLVVSVMGQTGVGKSSLVNALFGTELKTGAVQPTTLAPEPVASTDGQGHTLVFWDLPGIGEGEAADVAYLDIYRGRLAESDVALWAVHADTRAVAFDVEALRQLLADLPLTQQAKLFSKLVFVLTKSDLATSEPWILGRDRNETALQDAKFAPPRGGELLEQKAQYFGDALLKPFGHVVRAETYNDENFCLDLPSFFHDEHRVVYEGFLGAETLDGLVAAYPKHARLLRRLAENYEVVPCSALYRFNLTKIMLLVLNRLGPLALGRFKHFLSIDALDKLPFDAAKRYRNFVVYDVHQGQLVHDVAKATL